jgi:A/G-specific adenine glycosylase
MEFFNLQIHDWYTKNKRDLPWRNSRNPYFIWLSEIILQQTRIDQGLAYYLKFTDEFPIIDDLANASEDQVLKLWQGLGYYSRARNMLSTAKNIQKHFHGKFPEDYDSIRALKGIGEYTAAAIASIAFNLEYPAVDGNVYRILSRFFGILEPTDTHAGKKVYMELARNLIKGTNPGMHNQALMEFGALQCVPKNPDCTRCILNERCFAFSYGKISELPFKQNKVKQRARYFNYLIFENVNFTWLQQQTQNDIWKGLYQFPLVESSEKTAIGPIMSNGTWHLLTNRLGITMQKCSEWKTHILSHQKIHYRFFHINVPEEMVMPGEFVKVNKEDILSFAIPKLLEASVEEIANKTSIDI